MQLSRFFSLAEMTKSDSASQAKISNSPGDEATSNLKALCTEVLDGLREATGAAINVNSGYRSPELNAHIGGAKKSQHMEGKAADIQSSAISVLELFKKVIELGLPFDQVIYEAKSQTSKWVHVSHVASPRRGEILVADFGADGKVRAYRRITAGEALALSEPRTRSAVPELTYEEMADEPELEHAAEAAPKAAPKARTGRKARKPAARRKTPVKRKVAAKRKAVAKRKKAPNRKAKVKRGRSKAKKHK